MTWADDARSWVEVRTTVPAGVLAAVEAALTATGASAVTVAEGDGQPNFDPGTVWGSNVVTGLFEAGSLPADLESRVKRAAGEDLRVERVPVVGQDWAHAWKAHFGAFAVGDHLWVRPSWEGEATPEGRVELRLDPGMAFGTGQHETTRLCLAWLDQEIGAAEAPMVLDYGCGSGLLAIAAARLGAERIVAVDNDPQALAATRANAEANGVADRIHVAGIEDEPDWGPYPVVVANILSRTLMTLADTLTARVAPGGRMALSGILGPQAGEVRSCYPGIQWRDEAHEGEWVRIDGSRPAEGGYGNPVP